MRGRLWLVLGVAAASALVLVVSLVSVSVAGPNVTRLAVIEHATTDTVVDLTTNGDSTGDLLTFHNDLFDDERDRGGDGSGRVRSDRGGRELGVPMDQLPQRRIHHGRGALLR